MAGPATITSWAASGDDRLYGEVGADIINSGTGRDNIYLGIDADIDKIVIDTTILGNITNNRDNIYEFTTSDKIDISALLQEVGYMGANPDRRCLYKTRRHQWR
jgi:Ca2+-binding RTX toxin-like protein